MDAQRSPHHGRPGLGEAERYLAGLELFGMRFGLDRMRRLMTVLGHPEQSFGSIHIVGTNGKSSTARMIAAILAHHGVRTGAYLSPHLSSFTERIRIDGADLAPEHFADAVQRARRAAELVDRSAQEGDRVTQFEALTAAAYAEFARQRVEVAVVEAGLGGRYDATNILPSRVQVLTSVGLEHTRWLGPTIADIAREKLAVVQPGGTLVLGPGLHHQAEAEAELVAARLGARIVRAETDPGVELRAMGRYQRRNFAVARAAAEAYRGELTEADVIAAAAELTVPGRLQTIDQQPLTVLDGAHNPDGMAALVESLPDLHAAVRAGLPDEQADARPRTVVVVSILEDKDAAAMLTLLADQCDHLIACAAPSTRALPAPTLQSLARQVGAPAAEVVTDPQQALRRARELAGPHGLVLVTGSLVLVAAIVERQSSAGAGEPSAGRDRPRGTTS